MVKCAKKLLNLLTKCVNMLKGCLHQGGESLGSCVCARITSIFSFPRIHAPILPRKITKDYKKFSMWLQKKTKLKHRTHYAIFQNRPICVDRQTIWIGALCGLCILPYINGLRSALVCECGLLGCFIHSWLV